MGAQTHADSIAFGTLTGGSLVAMDGTPSVRWRWDVTKHLNEEDVANRDVSIRKWVVNFLVDRVRVDVGVKSLTMI